MNTTFLALVMVIFLRRAVAEEQRDNATLRRRMEEHEAARQ